MGSFRALNLPGSSPNDTTSAQANSGTKPGVGDLDVPAGGFVILTASLIGATGVELTGPDTSAYVDANFVARYETGMDADASFDVSATWPSGDAGLSMVALSWAV